MKNIAIIGYGIVGGGITGVLEAGKDRISKAVGDEVNVKYILDLLDFPDSPYADRIVHDINVILEDKDIVLVAETMGGAHPAFEFSSEAMKHGKNVVTSNKEVVAKYGDKLLEIAKQNNVSYLFEASVGGGIPVIRSFLTSLSQERVVSVNGILNGTTNFILSKMKSEKRGFDDVLAEAQSLGYAEKDPTADVDGYDARRKIIILAALATGKLVDEKDVYCETIANITPYDIDAADRIGGSLKLIGTACIFDEGMSIYVCPQIVMKENLLSSVDDVYNAISVSCDVTGDNLLYGRGAGRYPTAGAVVSDITAVLSGAAQTEKRPAFEKCEKEIKSFGSVAFMYYIRICDNSTSDIVEIYSRFFDEVKLIKGSPEGKTELICGRMTGKEFNEIKNSLGSIESVIRIHEC